jgi:hypothetical protein
MTVPHEDPDKLAAKLLAGELSPEETAALRAEIDADPDARDALARLEEVVRALRTWRQTFDTLPPPVVPQLPRRRWLRFWSTAAALLVAGLVAWALLRSRPGSTPPAHWAQDEFLSLVTVPRGSAATGDPHLWLGAPGDGPQFGGPGADGRPDGAPPPEAVPIFDQFRRQFDFSFRLPARLPHGYELERARPLSPSAVQLFYVAGDRRLQLYLKASSGPDQLSRLWEPAGQPGRRLWTARRGGIAVALEGEVDQSRFESLLPLFLPR